MFKMLVVDDVAINRLLIQEIFKEDYDILQANDGVEALELLNTYCDSIKIVMLDLIMPNMDGYKVLAEMQKVSKFSEIPVVVVTAADGHDDNVCAQNLGVVDIIKKPFDARNMRQRVKSIVQHEELEKFKVANRLLKAQTQAQHQLNALLNNMHIGVALLEVSESSIIPIYINNGLCAITGYTANILLENRDLLSMVVVDDKEIMAQAIKKILQNGAPFNIEIRITHKNGKRLWTRIQGFTVENDRDNPVLFFIVNDVTSFKKTANKLDETSRKLSVIMDNIPGGICIFEIGKRLKTYYFNDTMSEMLGWSREEYVERYSADTSSLIHREDALAVYQSFEKGLKTEKIENLDFRLRMKNGKYCWVRLNASKIGGKTDKPLFYSILIDISAQKKGLDDFYDSLPCGILCFSLGNEIALTSANKIACEILGFPNEESITLNVYKDEIEQFKEKFANDNVNERRGFEKSILNAKGEEKFLRGSYYQYYDQSTGITNLKIAFDEFGGK